MTREEALYELANAFKYNIDDRLQEAIDMAISALSEEENRPIKVRDDGTLFVKVLDVSKVERVIIGDDSMAIREDFPKPFSNNITESPNDVDETDDEVIEPSDIISRADAKKEVYLLGKNPSINEIWDCLDALPSADRPSGEWLKDYEKNIYKCSVCGCEEVVPTCMGEPTIWKYCPNCGSVIGARMKGGAE